MSKLNTAPKTAAPKTAARAAKVVPLPTATTTTRATAGTPPTAEQAMEAIRAFAHEQGTDWRTVLRHFWAGAGDDSLLYAARAVIPAAVLDSLNFKPARTAKPLTPEQAAARRLRAVGTKMRARAQALLRGAKEVHGLARQLRAKDSPEAVAALMRTMTEGGRLAALEAEAGA